MRFVVVLLALAACPVGSLVHPLAAESDDECVPVAVWRDGQRDGTVCRADAAAAGLTVLDLGDDWLPPALALAREDGYAATYRALAQERFDDAGGDGELARHDRFLELYGVAPALSVVRSRLADAVRERCHTAIDDAPLASAPARLGEETVTAAEQRSEAHRRLVRTVQAHLACDGLFEVRPLDGVYSWHTSNAVETFQRSAMILPSGVLDAQTRDALALPYRERAFRTALRVLRERVIAATGIVEDGTAGAGMATVQGRMLEPEATWRAAGHRPLAGAASDLISPATEAAARALGWLDPDATRAFLDELAADETSSHLVAVPLPAPPAYHGAAMQLAVEIDRGSKTRRPVLVLYAQDGERRIPLVRWPTTIGGWQKQKHAAGIVRQFKESPTGTRVWRDLYIEPRWLPPETTPDRELVRASDGQFVLAREQLGPSYRAAFGLVAFVHLVEIRAGDRVAYVDEAIRTHATGNLASLAAGDSHGCHRLLGHQALRLAGFVLAHHAFERRGEEPVVYHRTVTWHGELPVEIDSLGYHVELTPPLPVEVLADSLSR